MSKDRKEISRLMRAKGYTGFAITARSRRKTLLMQRLYESGGRVDFFEPLHEDSHSKGDILWCGNNSNTAAYLNELHSHPRQ
jgi:hypothetical protein